MVISTRHLIKYECMIFQVKEEMHDGRSLYDLRLRSTAKSNNNNKNKIKTKQTEKLPTNPQYLGRNLKVEKGQLDLGVVVEQ